MSSPVSQQINFSEFYVHPHKPIKNLIHRGRSQVEENNKQPNEVNSISVKYFLLDGKPVLNPYFIKGLQFDSVDYYRSLDSRGKIDESSIFKNTRGYLVVPADFNINKVLPFAQKINELYKNGHYIAAIALMHATFKDGGGLDIQRGASYGVPPREFDAAAVSASFIFGTTAELSGFPKRISEFGGGLNNLKNFSFSNMGWPYGLSRQDIENFEAGFAWTKAQMNDPHSIFCQQAKAFGLGTPNHKPPFGSIAPKGRFIIPQNKTNASNHASNEETGVGKTGQEALKKFLDVFSGGTTPTALTWLGQAGLPSHAGYSASVFHTPMVGTSAAAAAGRAKQSVNWHNAAITINEARSLAPHGADFRRRYSIIAGGPDNRKRDSQTASNNLVMQRLGFSNLSAAMRSSRSAQIQSNLAEAVQYDHVVSQDSDFVSRQEFGGLLEEHFNRQARLPPSGATGFDPRLSPAWAGLKLPN